jgi:hypothetical protein
MLPQPLGQIVIEVLLAPEHSGQCLTHHLGLILGQRIRGDGRIESVRFCLPGLEPGLERIPEGSPQPLGRLVRQLQSDRLAPLRRHGESVMGRCLGAV